MNRRFVTFLIAAIMAVSSLSLLFFIIGKANHIIPYPAEKLIPSKSDILSNFPRVYRENIFSASPHHGMKLVVNEMPDRSNLIIQNFDDSTTIAQISIFSSLKNCTWINKELTLLIVEKKGFFVPVLWNLEQGTLLNIEGLATRGSWVAPVYLSSDHSLLFFKTDFSEGTLAKYDINTNGYQVILDKMAGRSDVAISDSGRYVLASQMNDNTVLQMWELGSKPNLKSIQMPGRIREVSIGPEDDQALVTVRAPTNDTSFDLYIVNVVTGSFRVLAASSPEEDIRFPRWLNNNGDLVFQRACLHHGKLSYLNVLDGKGGETINDSGFLRPARPSHGGKGFVGVYSDRYNESRYVLVEIKARRPKLTFLEKANAADRIAAPVERWVNNPKTKKNVQTLTWGENKLLKTQPTVVLIHGGPALHISPTYDSTVATLIDKSIRVIAVNYAGSTGLGVQYERFTSAEEQVADVAAVVKAITANNKDIPIILVGHSYGTLIAAMASTGLKNYIDGVVLVSPGDHNLSDYSNSVPVLTVIGEFNEPSPVEITKHFNASLADGEKKHWRVYFVPLEGHDLSSGNGRVAVMSAIFKLLY